VVAVLDMLGQLDQILGDPERARARFVEALEATEATRGRGHPTATRVLTKLGWLAEEQGDLAEAERCFREAFERTREAEGEDDPATTPLLANLGSFLGRVGRLDEAEPLLVEASGRMDRERGPEDVEAIRALDRLAILAGARGQVDEALRLHREALARAAGLEPAHPARRGTREAIVDLLIEHGRFAEAYEQALLYHEEALRDLGPDASQVGAIARTLASLSRELERLDEAARWDGVAARVEAAGAD
jgi:tetratricopeptide (TPR) repeat protein